MEGFSYLAGLVGERLDREARLLWHLRAVSFTVHYSDEYVTMCSYPEDDEQTTWSQFQITTRPTDTPGEVEICNIIFTGYAK